MALPLRSPQPNAVARLTDDIAARRDQIRAELRQIETQVRKLCHEDSRLRAMQLLAGVEVEEGA